MTASNTPLITSKNTESYYGVAWTSCRTLMIMNHHRGSLMMISSRMLLLQYIELRGSSCSLAAVMLSLQSDIPKIVAWLCFGPRLCPRFVILWGGHSLIHSMSKAAWRSNVPCSQAYVPACQQLWQARSYRIRL